MIANHHQRKPPPFSDPPGSGGGVWATASGISRPDSEAARSAGLELNSLVALFQESSPPLNVWVTVSP